MNWILSIPSLFMNFGSIQSLFPLVLKYFSGNVTTDDLLKELKNLPAAAIKALEYIGSQRFPALAPEFHAIAVLTQTFHSDRIMWFQDAYNQLASPLIPLVVDGLPGPKTDAAILALQARFGLPVDGWLGEITSKAIHSLLDNKAVAPPATATPVIPQTVEAAVNPLPAATVNLLPLPAGAPAS